jgi:hypothetical protein
MPAVASPATVPADHVMPTDATGQRSLARSEPEDGYSTPDWVCLEAVFAPTGIHTFSERVEVCVVVRVCDLTRHEFVSAQLALGVRLEVVRPLWMFRPAIVRRNSERRLSPVELSKPRQESTDSVRHYSGRAMGLSAGQDVARTTVQVVRARIFPWPRTGGHASYADRHRATACAERTPGSTAHPIFGTFPPKLPWSQPGS